MSLVDRSIFVAGANGMVGRSLVRRLRAEGCANLLTPNSQELDLTDQRRTNEFFAANRPKVVIIAAAKVGGIAANNKYRADFIYQNLMIEANVIHAAFVSGTARLVMLGSSCIYPKMAPQPMSEEQLLAGYLEPTNEPYAIAKIAGIKLCESYYRQHRKDFYSVMPTNLYGPHDNFDLESSHVIPALIRKFHEAKVSNLSAVEIWGTGDPYREFMYVDDLADAVVHLLDSVSAEDIYSLGISHINVGTGTDIQIIEAAGTIADVVGFKGKIITDPSKPDGTPRKLLDITRLDRLGWKYRTGLREGLELTYDWFINNYEAVPTEAANL